MNIKKLLNLFFAGCFLFASHKAIAQGDDYIVHTIKKGEVISVLAKKYNVTVDEIIKLNKFRPNPVLHVGDKVKLPANARLSPQAEEPKAEPVAPAVKKDETQPQAATDTVAVDNTAQPVVHTIQRGEILSVLAKKYNVSVADIIKLNKFGPRPVLHVGDKIKLPASAHTSDVATVHPAQQPAEPVTPPNQQTTIINEPETQTPAGATMHMVKGKETLYAISKQYKVTVAQIKNWNHLTSDNISAGQKLIVRAGTASNQPAANTAVQKPAPQQKADAPVVVNSSPAVTLQQEKKKDPAPVVKQPVAPVVDANVPATGYFSSAFGKDVNGRSLQTANGAAMTFKTASGWTDKKFYVLMNDVPPGSIVQVSNADGKAIYAKVLWNMGDLKDNDGLTFRISDAAAAALDIKENKFQLAVTYYE